MPNIFGLVLTLLVTVMQLYVFSRAASVPLIRRHVPLRHLAWLAVITWAAFVATRLFAFGTAGAIGEAFEAFGMIWLGTLFLLCLAVLVVDVGTGFGLLWRRGAPSLRGGALIAGVVLAAIALVQGLRAPVVGDYPVYLADLPREADGTVIVALSDLHLDGPFGLRWLRARVAQVQAQHPDVIVLLGDVFEGHGPPAPELLAALRALSAPLGVWAVLGNHEFHGSGGAAEAWYEAAGFRPLRNAWVALRPGLVLAGLDNPAHGGRPSRTPAAVAGALAGRPAGATILRAHAPLAVDVVAGSAVDLMLFGHTHGGQLWPFGYLIRQFFPLYSGRYQVSGTTVIVSRGMGTWGPPMRLWQPGEILRVTLRRAPAAD